MAYRTPQQRMGEVSQPVYDETYGSGDFTRDAEATAPSGDSFSEPISAPPRRPTQVKRRVKTNADIPAPVNPALGGAARKYGELGFAAGTKVNNFLTNPLTHLFIGMYTGMVLAKEGRVQNAMQKPMVTGSFAVLGTLAILSVAKEMQK